MYLFELWFSSDICPGVGLLDHKVALFLVFWIFKKLINYLFIFGWCWVFVSVWGLSLVAASGGHSSSRCMGLSLSRPLVAEHRLQTRRLSSCGSQAHLLRGMWDLPRPGLEPVSPELAGRFSTTAPPGKPNMYLFELWFSPDICPGVGLLDHMVALFLSS